MSRSALVSATPWLVEGGGSNKLHKTHFIEDDSCGPESQPQPARLHAGWPRLVFTGEGDVYRLNMARVNSYLLLMPLTSRHTAFNIASSPAMIIGEETDSRKL